MQEARDQSRNGVAIGIGAYLLWGFLPVLLKALSAIPPLEVLSHRIIWSVILLAAVALPIGRWPAIVAVFRSPRVVAVMILTALLIAVNWLIYIWAITSNHMLEASLGYFINPLVNVLLGTLFLRERLRRNQILAVLLAALGVLLLAVVQGVPPWVSLALAFTFAIYGLVRKLAPVDPLTGLLVETALLAPFALLYVASLGADGAGNFGRSIETDLLLVLAGAITAAPLVMFAAAAKRLRFATVGLLQYISPSIVFLLAVLVFDEPLTTAHIVTFVCIWTGLILYASDSYAASRQAQAA